MSAAFRLLACSGEIYWGVPTVCRGLLYVNQNAMGSRLICYDLRG